MSFDKTSIQILEHTLLANGTVQRVAVEGNMFKCLQASDAFQFKIDRGDSWNDCYNGLGIIGSEDEFFSVIFLRATSGSDTTVKCSYSKGIVIDDSLNIVKDRDNYGINGTPDGYETTAKQAIAANANALISASRSDVKEVYIHNFGTDLIIINDNPTGEVFADWDESDFRGVPIPAGEGMFLAAQSNLYACNISGSSADVGVSVFFSNF